MKTFFILLFLSLPLQAQIGLVAPGQAITAAKYNEIAQQINMLETEMNSNTESDAAIIQAINGTATLSASVWSSAYGFNTITQNQSFLQNLVTNNFTLSPGKYYIEASISGRGVTGTNLRARLRNNTTSTEICYGNLSDLNREGTDEYGQLNSILKCGVTLTQATSLAIQYFASSGVQRIGSATYPQGIIKIERLGDAP